MTDFWEAVLRFTECLKCIYKCSWVFFALFAWLKNHNIFLFWKFFWDWCNVGGTPRIIKKVTDFWKIVLDSSECQKYIERGYWVSLDWSRDSEITGSDILEVLFRLSLNRRNTPNYWQNDDEFLEIYFFVNNLAVGNSLRYFIRSRENHWLLRLI